MTIFFEMSIGIGALHSNDIAHLSTECERHSILGTVWINHTGSKTIPMISSKNRSNITLDKLKKNKNEIDCWLRVIGFKSMKKIMRKAPSSDRKVKLMG